VNIEWNPLFENQILITMTEFWDLRFAEPSYAYGTEPNQFFKEQLIKLPPGKILFPAEGEGRNAVFAAKQGFEVYAFDYSNEGQKKAQRLAAESKVSIDYSLASYDSVEYAEDFFDVIVLIFAHMPAQKRKEWHRKLAGFLKPGGKIILEGFSKDQLKYRTGGPPNLEMLFSEEELADDFEDLVPLLLNKEVVSLDEGSYHRGDASVIRGIFKKELFPQ
jgi:SAM-dependent methyltransferase